jgi:hypothetical protein
MHDAGAVILQVDDGRCVFLLLADQESIADIDHLDGDRFLACVRTLGDHEPKPVNGFDVEATLNIG